MCLFTGMDLIRIYECLCDATRLRILHLLTHGPLCVCHIQEILKVVSADATDDEIVAACRAARIHDLIAALPDVPPADAKTAKEQHG